MGKNQAPVPDRALEQHLAIVGKTGSGKTYTAKGLVERMLADGQRVCVLDALAWWAVVGVDAPTRAQVGFVAGLKPGGGHFNNTVGPLKTIGLIEYPQGGSVRGTDLLFPPELV